MKRRKRFAGIGIVLAVVLGLAAIGTFVLGRSYSELALSTEPFDRNQYVPSFDPIEDVTLGLSPNSSNVVAAKPKADIHVVEVYPSQTLLLAGGQAVKTFDTPAPATLQALVALVNNPEWLSVSGATVTMRAAIVLQGGAAMRVVKPATTEVVMTARPGVFLAANDGSRLSLSGVYVHASDKATPTTDIDPELSAGRPFIWAVANSVMDIADSTFRYLGRDWNSSYGVSWSKGATGSVTGSLFEHDFIGVYSNASPSLKVTHNRFYTNSLYGVDPHSGSTHQDIEWNVSDLNGRHGIIFSDHVTQSRVEHNTTIGNGLNGIMMDEQSAGNVVADNVVQDNQSDGIVLASSSRTQVTSNTISGNRVGIVSRGTTAHSSIQDNTITGNKLAGQGARLSGGHNHVVNNGGEWSVARMALVWLASAILLALLLGATAVSGWRTRRRASATEPREVSLV